VPRSDPRPTWKARAFAAFHRRTLVYVICWEDPAVDRLALDIGPDDEVMTITSGGCNALDLLLAEPRAVHAVDVNPLQTAMLELRVAAIRGLDDASVMELLGGRATPRAREMYHDAVRARLSDDARVFWDDHLHWFTPGGWREGLFYRGSAGFAHKLLRDYAFRARGLGGVIEATTATPDLETQRALHREHRVRERFAGLALRWFLSRDVALALMGIPDAQRAAIERHPGGVIGRSLDVIDAAFTQTRLASNYFWRGVLQGGYASGCRPEYLEPRNLARLRGGLLDRLHLHTTTVERFVATHDGSLSRFVLLDHLDWLSTWATGALEAEWDTIVRRARPGARVIFRSACPDAAHVLGVSVSHRGRRVPLDAILLRHDARAAELHKLDRTATYASFHIADLPAEMSA
jgi:S-adenosylmethionine-diacylglycerol 3-amino-3-carboxypropyl transferase